ncbi:MAG: magnesium/cobalt transporter CorA [Chitinophagaceae bacterium]|nr:magnesium/cobalt transporter CorA [Chitinophagaceae bacterium]
MKFERLRPDKYLKYLKIPNPFVSKRTQEILLINPTVVPEREEAEKISVSVYDYDEVELDVKKSTSLSDCLHYRDNNHITWINIDGLRKKDVETVCAHYGIHSLICEDILSINQRPKIDEEDGYIFCLLNMLYYNDKNFTVEQEQISIVVVQNVVISFQEDPRRDVFTSIREKLALSGSKIRQRGVDYLCYKLLDMIVDHYFTVMEKLGERIEDVEEEVTAGGNTGELTDITHLRKELIILKRNITPVREVINVLLRSENKLLEERHDKYFKDVYDHIVQASELVENYRDVVVGLQDLHINNVNLRMNEVMKVMAVVTCLLAPATVIGGIFGMNFTKIPFLDNHYGFWAAVAFMLLIPVAMIWLFKKRGWF